MATLSYRGLAKIVTPHIPGIRHTLSEGKPMALSDLAVLAIPGAVRVAEDILRLPLTGNLADMKINFPTQYYTPNCGEYHPDCIRMAIRSGHDVDSDMLNMIEPGDVEFMAYCGLFESVDRVLNKPNITRFELDKYSGEAIDGTLQYLRVFGSHIHPDNLKHVKDKLRVYFYRAWPNYDMKSYLITLKLWTQPPDETYDSDTLTHWRLVVNNVLKFPCEPHFLTQIRMTTWGERMILESHETNIEWLVSQSDFNIRKYELSDLLEFRNVSLFERWEQVNGIRLIMTEFKFETMRCIAETFNRNPGDMDLVTFVVTRGYQDWDSLAGRAAKTYELTIFRYAISMGGMLPGYMNYILDRNIKLRSYIDSNNSPSPEVVIPGDFW